MKEVRLLKPEEVGLTEKIQLFEDGLRTEAKRGSYEWWCFDSKFPDGSSLVIIFSRSMLPPLPRTSSLMCHLIISSRVARN